MATFDDTLGQGPFSLSKDGARQREVFVCTFGLLSLVCSIDGDLDQKELLVVDGIMKNALKLDSDRRKFATAVFNQARKAKPTIDELLKRYKASVADRPKMNEWLMDALFRLSIADEVLAQEEVQILDRAQEILEVTDIQMNTIRDRYVKVSNNSEAYLLLGVPDGASKEEVHAAYQKLMSSYDVEHLLNEGFAQELIDIAQKKQADFTTAYLAIEKKN